MSFEKELEGLINRYSMENGSNTPDFLLAEYLRNCLDHFDLMINKRDKWYGVKLEPGMSKETIASKCVMPCSCEETTIFDKKVLVIDDMCPLHGGKKGD